MHRTTTTRLLLWLGLLPATAGAQSIASTPVDIRSGGLLLRGQVFAAEAAGPRPTVLLIPGWPGNARDVLGLGALLVKDGVNVVMFNPRGMHGSEGTLTFAGVQEDVGAAFAWLHSPEVVERFRVDTSRLALGGHSFGGGMATSYAARDPRVRRLISIAGGDHAVTIREVDSNPAFAERFRTMLRSTQAPAGPVRFDIDATLQELRAGTQTYGNREVAPRLAGRSVLVFGGWEDRSTTIEQTMLPFYRALKTADVQDVTFLVYHTDHDFAPVRAQLAAAIRDWLLREGR